MSDPFLDFLEQGDMAAQDFERFTLHIAAWMQRSKGVSITRAFEVWKSSAPLRRWMAKHLGAKVTSLYYGKMVSTLDELPQIGDTWTGPFSILHWSKDMELSKLFAGFMADPEGAGGYLVEADPVPPREVIVDIAGLSALCRRYPDSFQMVQINPTAAKILLSRLADGEKEVLTTSKVTGLVLDARTFRKTQASLTRRPR